MIVTITLEDKEDGKVTMTSDPPLTRLMRMAKEEAHRGTMTPATAYALVAISQVRKRHREMSGKEGTWIKGRIPSALDIIRPN